MRFAVFTSASLHRGHDGEHLPTLFRPCCSRLGASPRSACATLYQSRGVFTANRAAGIRQRLPPRAITRPLRTAAAPRVALQRYRGYRNADTYRRQDGDKDAYRRACQALKLVTAKVQSVRSNQPADDSASARARPTFTGRSPVKPVIDGLNRTKRRAQSRSICPERSSRHARPITITTAATVQRRLQRDTG